MSLLHTLSILSLVLAAVSALIIAADLMSGRRQKMQVMNWVWPITSLWAGPLGLWAYLRFGRAQKPAASGNRKQSKKPFSQIVTVGTLHCAAGCTVGDFVGEWVVFFSALTIAGSTLWSDYLLDFALAYTVGVVFQYFAIAPMRNLSGWAGISAAVKADTISLVAFELGMFAWMAFTHKVLFTPPLEPTEPAYWFMMQIAMAVGFLTAYPANAWLIRKGLKEAM